MGGDKEDEEEKEEEKEVEGWEEGKGEGRARRKRDRNRVTKAERPTGELGRRKVTSGPLKEPQERGGKRRKRGRRGEERRRQERRVGQRRKGTIGYHPSTSWVFYHVQHCYITQGEQGQRSLVPLSCLCM